MMSIANMQRQPMQGLLLHRPPVLLPPMSHPVHPVVHGLHLHGAACNLTFHGLILLRPHRIPRTTGWCFLIQTCGSFFLCGLFVFRMWHVFVSGVNDVMISSMSHHSGYSMATASTGIRARGFVTMGTGEEPVKSTLITCWQLFFVFTVGHVCDLSLRKNMYVLNCSLQSKVSAQKGQL